MLQPSFGALAEIDFAACVRLWGQNPLLLTTVALYEMSPSEYWREVFISRSVGVLVSYHLTRKAAERIYRVNIWHALIPVRPLLLDVFP